jgi:hypothetical protein
MTGSETRGPVSTGFGNTLAGFTSPAGIPPQVEQHQKDCHFLSKNEIT